MKLVTSITKSLCIVLYLVSLVLGSINCAYASKEELLDLEEEKSDIEDRIEERRARGQSYEDLEERRNDVQDEMDNVKEEGWAQTCVLSNVSLQECKSNRLCSKSGRGVGG